MCGARARARMCEVCKRVSMYLRAKAGFDHDDDKALLFRNWERPVPWPSCKTAAAPTVSHAVISGTVGLLPTVRLSNPTAERELSSIEKRTKLLVGKGYLKIASPSLNPWGSRTWGTNRRVRVDNDSTTRPSFCLVAGYQLVGPRSCFHFGGAVMVP